MLLRAVNYKIYYHLLVYWPSIQRPCAPNIDVKVYCVKANIGIRSKNCITASSNFRFRDKKCFYPGSIGEPIETVVECVFCMSRSLGIAWSFSFVGSNSELMLDPAVLQAYLRGFAQIMLNILVIGGNPSEQAYHSVILDFYGCTTFRLYELIVKCCCKEPLNASFLFLSLFVFTE